MKRSHRPLGFVLAILITAAQHAHADPIQLLVHEITVPVPTFLSSSNSGELPDAVLTMPDLSHGGSIALGDISLGNTSGLTDPPYPSPQSSMNGSFGMLVGVAGTNGNEFSGPVLDIVGNVTGTIDGPAGSPARYSGSFSGTAANVSVLSGNASDLPAPLLDVLNFPDHLHISGSVGGGDENLLSYTLTFDPPAPAPVPEPTVLAIVGVCAVWAGLRRFRRHRA